MDPADPARMRVVGRYALYDEIAAGGMATVHFGRLLGHAGFSRPVAIKKLHPQEAKDPEFAAMFLDEARLAARVRHPNVVTTLDVVSLDGELLLVLEYIHGESLARLLKRASDTGAPVPWRVALSVVAGVLHGLHAAHEARNERGERLDLVHRDVSPHNIVVGVDGIARVLDFGIAKAENRLSMTRGGVVKGKLSYMAPEQVRGLATRQSDVFAASIVLWESLTVERLFAGENDGETIDLLRGKPIPPPSTIAPGLPPGLDAIVLRGLERSPEKRFATAREMALALEACAPFAPATEVGAWVESTAHEALASRAAKLSAIEGQDATQSTMTAAAVPTGARRRGARRTVFLAIAAFVTGVAVVSAAVALRPARTSPGLTAPASSLQAVAPALDPLPETPPPAAVDTAAPSQVVTSPSARPAARSNVAPARPSKPPHACDPPYSLDADGHKHFKPECVD